MIKFFQKWLKVKEDSHFKKDRKLFNSGEIWNCRLGTNVGDEQDGKGDLFLRPVLIIRKFNRRIFVGLPLSSVIKGDNEFYCTFKFKGKLQSVILSQIRLLDAKKFQYKMGKISKDDLAEIKNKAKKLIFEE